MVLVVLEEKWVQKEQLSGCAGRNALVYIMKFRFTSNIV